MSWDSIESHDVSRFQTLGAAVVTRGSIYRLINCGVTPSYSQLAWNILGDIVEEWPKLRWDLKFDMARASRMNACIISVIINELGTSFQEARIRIGFNETQGAKDTSVGGFRQLRPCRFQEGVSATKSASFLFSIHWVIIALRLCYTPEY